MKPFYDLRPQGRIRRLRTLALAALQEYELALAGLRFISDGWNYVFRVDTTGGEKFVLRVTRPTKYGPTDVRSEMIWLDALHRETDLLLPAPLRTRRGELFTTVQVEGVPEARHVVVFSWVPGKDLGDVLTPQNYASTGELLARLHQHAATWTPPDGFAIRRNDTVFNPTDQPHLFEPAFRDRLNERLWGLLSVAYGRVAEAQAELWGRGQSPQVIHYDLHQYNVKVHRGRVYPIDFEDLVWGYPVQDIGLIFYYIQSRDDAAQLHAAFREGYTRRLPWPETYPGEVALHTLRRTLDFANLLIDEQDPQEQEFIRRFFQRTEERLARLFQSA
ncbi:MAG: phosphotransferase [Caldilineaceae bacterium]|nr:phosphotransferase [Caldilineaceae bacterium]